MRAAALYDIHGNLPALEAVLEEIESLDVEQIVIGGDVLPGPMPRETLQRLKRIQVPVAYIRGNGEVAVLEETAGRRSAVSDAYRPGIQWNASQIGDEWREIASWPLSTRMKMPGIGDVLFCHATPQNENDIFTQLTGDERLLPMFKGVNAAVVVCGHTHMQFDRRVGNVRVINAGSVGMVFGRPGADWLLITDAPQFRHTNYDLQRAAARIRASEYPMAAEFADKNVLNPPTEEDMLALFQRASK